jgi:hypothetical protein
VRGGVAVYGLISVVREFKIGCCQSHTECCGLISLALLTDDSHKGGASAKCLSLALTQSGPVLLVQNKKETKEQHNEEGKTKNVRPRSARSFVSHSIQSAEIISRRRRQRQGRKITSQRTKKKKTVACARARSSLLLLSIS